MQGDEPSLVTAFAKPETKRAVIAVHGYGAGPSATLEVAQSLERRGLPVSRVRLGGHGEGQEVFRTSTWRNWGEPVIREYERLGSLGYSDVRIVTQSAGGTIVADLLANARLRPPPARIAMVAPVLEFKNRMIPMTRYLGPLLPADLAPVGQLADLAEHVSSNLKWKITLAPEQAISILQAKGDPIVDPHGNALWAQGFTGGTVTVRAVDSNLHIPYSGPPSLLKQQLLGEIGTFLDP